MIELLTGLGFFAVCAAISIAMNLIRGKVKEKYVFALTGVFQLLRVLLFTGAYFLVRSTGWPFIPALIGAAVGLTLPGIVMTFVIYGKKKPGAPANGEPTGETKEEEEDGRD